MMDAADYVALVVTLSVALIQYATFEYVNSSMDDVNSSVFITRTVFELLSSLMFNIAL